MSNEPKLENVTENIQTIKPQTSSEGFQSTGPQAFRSQNSKYYFSTYDLLVIAILGVMGGFISGLIPFSLLVKTWYPFVGGSQLTSGHHFIWLALAYGITKKKVSILLTAVIKAFVMFLIGGEWGIVEIPISLYEGSALVLGFYLVEKVKEGDTNLGWAIAGGLGCISQVPLFWLMTGKIETLHYTLFIMALMFAFASGAIFAGILTRFIIKRLSKAGII